MKSNLELKQEQKLGLQIVPSQLKLGRVLEMSDPAFHELVKSTVEENPALELIDNGIDTSMTVDYTTTNENHDYQNINKRIWNNGESQKTIDNIADSASTETLYQYLLNQVSALFLDEETKNLVEFLIGNIDNKGYLSRSESDLINDYILSTGNEPDQKIIEEAWDILYSLDPPGIGAKDLQESLLWQLMRKDEDPEVNDAINIISKHFNIFINNNLAQLKKISKLDEQRFQNAIKLITQLNPYPGKEFLSWDNEIRFNYIYPDFSVLPDIEIPDTLQINILSYNPDLTIDPTFIAEGENIKKRINRKDSTKELQKAALFLKERRDEAENFIKLVQMRHSTMQRIITAIADIQKDYFLSGDKTRLKPMILKDIATKTGDDISVISRTTSGRYVVTLNGIIPLKDLFNESKGNENPEFLTSIHIEELLQKIIKEEDKSEPYSDEAIALKLKEYNINIARRTVSKYRDVLGIPSARQRKSQV